MIKTNIKTPFAKVSTDVITDASQLIPASSADQSTDYFCPDCNTPVRRRKSVKDNYHFFHLNSEHSCAGGGLETTLHLLAKQVVEQTGKIWLPDAKAYYRYFQPIKTSDKAYSTVNEDNPIVVEINTILQTSKAPNFYHVYFEQNNDYPAEFFNLRQDHGLHIAQMDMPISFGLCEVTNVRLEQSIENIRPDIIATIGNKDYLIEVANTHFIDDEKREKIKRLGIPCVEIDLRQIKSIDFESVKQKITKRNTCSKWIHFSTDKELLAEFNALKTEADKTFIRKKEAAARLEFLQKKQSRIKAAKESSRMAKEKFLAKKQREEAEKQQLIRDEENQRLQQKLESLKVQLEKENDYWVQQGFKPFSFTEKERQELSFTSFFNVGTPKLINVIEKYLKAIALREKRISHLGLDDLVSKHLTTTYLWSDLEKEGQLFDKEPKILGPELQLFYQIEEKRKAEERFLEKMEIEKNRDMGLFNYCPKCRKPSFKFITVKDRQQYARECIRKECGHKVVFEINDD